MIATGGALTELAGYTPYFSCKSHVFFRRPGIVVDGIYETLAAQEATV
jgi:hypothetical protein